DVRMRELRDGLRLALEALAPVGGGGEMGGEHLDRDRPLEARVAGAVDLAHPAGTSLGQDLVGAEASAGGERHGFLRVSAQWTSTLIGSSRDEIRWLTMKRFPSGNAS